MQRQGLTTTAARRQSLVIPALIVMTWTVYAQVWRYEFVNFDDPIYSYENAFVLSGINYESVRWAFGSESSALSANWFPLTWLSLMVDGQLHGKYAGGFHLTNVLFHMMNAVLVYSVLLRMTHEKWKSAFVAALFAVHPLHVESVAWISERKDVLSTFFGLISLWAYAHYARRPAAVWYGIALTAFALSLLSKQTLVTLPFLLLMLDYWPLRRTPWASATNESADVGYDLSGQDSEGPPADESYPPRSWSQLLWEKMPFIVLAAVFCAVALLSQQRGDSLGTLDEFSLARRVSNALVVLLIYIAKTVWPSQLSVYYPYPQSIPLLHSIAAFVLLIVVTSAALAQKRTRPYLLVGWLWYLGTLMPVIGLIQIGWQRMADRYTYVPLIGLFVVVAWLVPSLIRSSFWQKTVGPILAGTVLLGLTVTAWIQTGYWQNNVTLFEHAIAVNDHNTTAHNNLGLAFRDLERPDEAIQQFRKVLSLDSDNFLAHNNLGLTLRNLGRFDESIQHFKASLSEQPGFNVARVNLGITLCLQNKDLEGVAQFRRVLKSQPDNLTAHLCLATVLRDLGEVDEAQKHAEHARALASKVPNFRDRLETGFRFPR